MDKYRKIKSAAGIVQKTESPVTIEQYTIYYDMKKQNCVLDIELKNDSELKAKTVFVEIKSYSQTFDAIEVFEHEYKKANIAPGDYYQDKKMISLESKIVRSVDLKVVEVEFANGDVWLEKDVKAAQQDKEAYEEFEQEENEEEFEVGEAYEAAEELESEMEFESEYHAEEIFGAASEDEAVQDYEPGDEYDPDEYDDENYEEYDDEDDDEPRRGIFKLFSRFKKDEDYEEDYDEYDEDADDGDEAYNAKESDEEYYEEEFDPEAIAARRKNLFRILIAAGIAAVLIGFFGGGYMLFKNDFKVLSLQKNGQYQELVEILPDTIFAGSDKSIYKLAGKMAESGEYDVALQLYSLCKDYKDAGDQILEIRYQIGCAQMEAGKYVLAATTFYHLGDYKDAADLNAQCKSLQ